MQDHGHLSHAITAFIGQVHREWLQRHEHRLGRGLVQRQLLGIGIMRGLQEEPSRTASTGQHHGQDADQQALATFLLAFFGFLARIA